MSEVDPIEVNNIVNVLAEATSENATQGETISSEDLRTTNQIISLTVNYLVQNVELMNATNPLPFSEASSVLL